MEGQVGVLCVSTLQENSTKDLTEKRQGGGIGVVVIQD